MKLDDDFFREIIDNLFDGVYFVNKERVITFWNKGAERITGYPASQVLGRSCRDNLLNHIDSAGNQLCLGLCPLAACMEDAEAREAEVILHHADGHRVPVLVRVSAIRDQHGGIVGAVETFSPAAETISLRQLVSELRHTTRTDILTGIGNRVYLDGRLRAVIAEYEGHTPAAGLLFLDIDHFKQFNDLYGHDVGDKVLRMVASTLSHNLRKSDVVGRWGGEEFIAILYEVASAEELRLISEKLRMLIEASRLDLGNAGLRVTVSGGATLFQADDTPESVVQRADALMYQSKRAGLNQISVG